MQASTKPSIDRLAAARGIICGLGISCSFWLSLVLYLTLGASVDDKEFRGPIREASIEAAQNRLTSQKPVR